MITDSEKWHYFILKSLPKFDGRKWLNLAAKSLSALFRGITSNHNGDFSCLNYFHSYNVIKNLENTKKYVMIMIIVM